MNSIVDEVYYTYFIFICPEFICSECDYFVMLWLLGNLFTYQYVRYMASWTLNLSILLFAQMVLNVSITETVEPTSVGISIFIVTVILTLSRLTG